MKKIYLPIFACLTLLACSKDDEKPMDTEKPIFKMITVNGTESIDGKELEIRLLPDTSNQLKLNITASDNEELSQLQVEIHEAFDSHSHSRLAETKGDTLAFGPKIYPLTGKESTAEITVGLVKNTVYGEYHIECVLLDKKGNRTEKIVALHLEEEKK